MSDNAEQWMMDAAEEFRQAFLDELIKAEPSLKGALELDPEGGKRFVEMTAAIIAKHAPKEPEGDLQQRVDKWLIACFGETIARDPIERNHRFLEEALELVQACGCTQSEAHQLVDYVFERAVGEKNQECGGVMVTLAALCLAQNLNMNAAAETELARIWTKVEKIRAKQAAKPKHSPLPQAPRATQGKGAK